MIDFYKVFTETKPLRETLILKEAEVREKMAMLAEKKA